MDKNNNIVIKEKTSKTNIVIITVAIVVLIAGAFGIWWYSNRSAEVVVETVPEIVEELEQEIALPSSEIIAYNGQTGRTALELLREQFGGRVEFEMTADGVEIVRAIDGIASDETRHWELFINGALADQDPNLYITTDTDLLEWRLSDSLLLTDPEVMY